MSNAKKQFEFRGRGLSNPIFVGITEDGEFEYIKNCSISTYYPKSEWADFAELYLKEVLDHHEREFKEMASYINKNSLDYLIIFNVVKKKIAEIETKIKEANEEINELSSIL